MRWDNRLMTITSPSAALAAQTQATAPRRIQATDFTEFASKAAPIGQRPEPSVEVAPTIAPISASVGPQRDLTKFVRPGSLLDIRA